MIIIPGQGGTYRYFKGSVTGLLADSGLTVLKEACGVVPNG
jgi:hypothetical protein